MDKFKEKIGSLRGELEAAQAKIIELDKEKKKNEEDISAKDQEITMLQRKVGTLESDLDETEKGFKEATE
ncbi:17667_t:CDS:2, partial [Funneliformis geosporum]